MEGTQMKINFILNAMGISGGVKAVFMFGNELKKLGHTVNVIYPQMPLRIGAKIFHPVQLVKEAGYLTLNRWQPLEWYKDVNVIHVQSLLHNQEIPDADVTIATQWETAYYVNGYPKSKGEKYYLVQDFENWHENKAVIETYKMGLKNIVHSKWLKHMVMGINAQVEAVIPHAPDHSQFYPEPTTREWDAPVRVLMCYRKEKWKGIAAGVEAYNQVKGTNTRIVMFGLLPSNDFKVDEYYQNPPQDQIRRIYNSCDIFLFTSEREGWGMPPMEAMACGVATISTNVGAVPEFITSGINGVIANDVGKMIIALELLIGNKHISERIGNAGHKTMNNYTWEKSAKMLEEVLCKQ